MTQLRFDHPNYTLFYSKFAHKIKCKDPGLSNAAKSELRRTAGKSVCQLYNWHLYYKTKDDIEKASALLSSYNIVHDVFILESNSVKEFLMSNQTVKLGPKLPFGKYRYAALVEIEVTKYLEFVDDVLNCNGRSVFASTDWYGFKRTHTFRVYLPSDTELLLFSIKHNPVTVTEFITAQDVEKIAASQ